VTEGGSEFGENVGLIRAERYDAEGKSVDQVKRNARGVDRVWGDIEMMIQLFLIERRVNATILDGQGQVHEGNGFGSFGESPFHSIP
jgi:hypothetical protein